MKRLLVFVFALVLLGSCSDFSNYKIYGHYEVTDFDSLGVILKYESKTMTPLNGILDSYSDSGLYLNGKKEGTHREIINRAVVKFPTFEFYHLLEDIEIIYIGSYNNYKSNKLVGKSISFAGGHSGYSYVADKYYEDSKGMKKAKKYYGFSSERWSFISECNFKNDTLNGPAKLYNNGELTGKFNFLNGNLNGECIEYKKHYGKVYAEYRYYLNGTEYNKEKYELLSNNEIISSKPTINENIGISIKDNSFEKASDKLMISMLFEASDLMNMTENEQINQLKELYPTTTIYVRRNNIEENIVINKTKSFSLSDLSSYYENKYEEMEEMHLSNTGFSSEMIENKIIEIDDKYECLVFRAKLFGEELNKYSSIYHLEVNNQFYHITTNTYTNESFNDLIVIE